MSTDYKMKARYINPYTDVGFKKIFGEEASKPLLIDFLKHLEDFQTIPTTFNDEVFGQAFEKR